MADPKGRSQPWLETSLQNNIMEAGIPLRILDAIQGQAPRTVAETYGEVTMTTMVSEIAKLPFYKLHEEGDAQR
ncbi:hypothetical protein LB565_20065 [Mesorhizobium sp. CA14]|uniref:hypothetical protein n=1 Tax=Mesorhizobium sp. CA14 TaxID=2876642 RepID=UPI001CCD4BF6|nr:hypothetical protein [Mesorhizobium sp. CA14]MBZ9850283.1 hypothetical protein [Mesorhizobium sp. CA14]